MKKLTIIHADQFQPQGTGLLPKLKVGLGKQIFPSSEVVITLLNNYFTGKDVECYLD